MRTQKVHISLTAAALDAILEAASAHVRLGIDNEADADVRKAMDAITYEQPPRPADNARFWVYVHGWTKLTLKPDQVLHHSQGGPDEEGWHSEYHEWTYYDEEVTEQRVTDGRDCDGRLTDTDFFVCHRRNLRSQTPPNYETGDPLLIPTWHRTSGRRYDEYAEKAGY